MCCPNKQRYPVRMLCNKWKAASLHQGILSGLWSILALRLPLHAETLKKKYTGFRTDTIHFVENAQECFQNNGYYSYQVVNLNVMNLQVIKNNSVLSSLRKKKKFSYQIIQCIYAWLELQVLIFTKIQTFRIKVIQNYIHIISTCNKAANMRA